MLIDNFQNLTLLQRAEFAMKHGTFLVVRIERDHKRTLLYFLNHYIEVIFNCKKVKVEAVNILKDSSDLDFFLEKIEMSYL